MVSDLSGPVTEGLTPRAARKLVQARLAAAGVPDADFDAAQLTNAALGGDSRLLTAPLTPAQAQKLESLTARRCQRQPLQYLLGEWDFLDFTLAVGEGVLCPRGDTEVVAQLAADTLKDAGCKDPAVLDLCAGSGCLGLGIKRLVPDAQVRCVELSEVALPYLRRNADTALARFGVAAPAVQVVRADVLAHWQTLPPAGLDLIVSNPPYLTETEMTALMPETAHEPAMALDGGTDGLDFYRCLLRDYRQALRPGGAMVLEIGWQQAQALAGLAGQYGWQNFTLKQDYGGNDRAVRLQKVEDSEKSG